MLYAYLIQVDIVNIQKDVNSTTQYNFTINSKIDQNIKLHVATNHKLESIHCNQKNSDFKYFEYYTYKIEEQVNISLKKGKNHCLLINSKACKSKNLTHTQPIIKQKISFINYLLLFILFIIPLFHLLFQTLIWILNKIWRKTHA